MSNSVKPHRWQPTRLPCPWDPPGKNTGVGCHFLLQCMKVKSKREVAQSCRTLSDPMECSPPGSSIHGIFQARVLEWGAIAFSNIDQWNKIDGLEIYPHTYGNLTFEKGGQNIQWRKDSFFSKWCWENWSTTRKRMKLEQFLTLCTKINAKWLKDVSAMP